MLELVGYSGQELVEHVVIALVVRLAYDARLFQQILRNARSSDDST